MAWFLTIWRAGNPVTVENVIHQLSWGSALLHGVRRQWNWSRLRESHVHDVTIEANTGLKLTCFGGLPVGLRINLQLMSYSRRILRPKVVPYEGVGSGGSMLRGPFIRCCAILCSWLGWLAQMITYLARDCDSP